MYTTVGKWHKIILTKEGERFLKKNFMSMTNQQLADAMSLKITRLRGLLYGLGLKRMELEYFTDEQVLFLKKYYKTIGDTELAELFTLLWPKAKGWTLKHIEKKRLYLNLNRTGKQILAIRTRNTVSGSFAICPVKAWDKRVRAKIGSIRIWKDQGNQPFKVIKTKKGFVHYAPWLYRKTRGRIPKGKMVSFLDGNRLNVVSENLILVTRAENAIRNAAKSSRGLSDNYVAGIITHGQPHLRNLIKQSPELISVKRAQLLLNREIKKIQHDTANSQTNT